MVTSLAGLSHTLSASLRGTACGSQRLGGSDVPAPGRSTRRPCAAQVSTNRQQLTPSAESACRLLVVKQGGVILKPCPVAFSEFAMAPRANWKGFLRLSLV